MELKFQEEREKKKKLKMSSRSLLRGKLKFVKKNTYHILEKKWSSLVQLNPNAKTFFSEELVFLEAQYRLHPLRSIEFAFADWTLYHKIEL